MQPDSCMLRADAALRDSLEQFLGARSAKGSTYVSCSTVSASLVKVSLGIAPRRHAWTSTDPG